MRWLPGTEILTWVVAKSPRLGGSLRGAARPVRSRARRGAVAATLAPVDRRPPRSDELRPVVPVDGGETSRTDGLERWAADARVAEAARARSRERWLRRQAEEDATLAGVLADLLEGGVPVVVHTRAGGCHAGTVRSVGVDFVALGSDGRREGEVVMALAALASVRVRSGTPAVVGDRDGVGAGRLADVLAALAAERTEVRVVTADGESLAGVVRWVGQDVVVIAGRDRSLGLAYLPVDAVSEVVVGG